MSWPRELENCLSQNTRSRGSSQLFENEKISPDDINDPIILREARADYMYLDCIVFIKKALC